MGAAGTRGGGSGGGGGSTHARVGHKGRMQMKVKCHACKRRTQWLRQGVGERIGVVRGKRCGGGGEGGGSRMTQMEKHVLTTGALA